jgi:hypothetical protein
VKSLQPVLQHGTVSFLQDVQTDFHPEVGSYSEDVLVERGVVELAKGQAISNDRFSLGMPIRQYVRGVQ